jgi:hypothetical protein
MLLLLVFVLVDGLSTSCSCCSGRMLQLQRTQLLRLNLLTHCDVTAAHEGLHAALECIKCAFRLMLNWWSC